MQDTNKTYVEKYFQDISKISSLIDISKITDFIYEEYSYIVDNIISINKMDSETETEIEIED